MIVVTVEIWPQGNRHEATELGRVVVASDGTGTPEIGHYHAWHLEPSLDSEVLDQCGAETATSLGRHVRAQGWEKLLALACDRLARRVESRRPR